MEVILLENMDNLGEKGEVAEVSGGYARNYLIPRGLAEKATAARKEAALRQMQEKEERERRAAEQAGNTRDLLAKTVLTIPVSAGQGERLFGSVTNQDIAQAIKDARGMHVDKKKIELEEPIKSLGQHMVKVNVHPSVEPAEVKVIVVGEEEE